MKARCTWPRIPRLAWWMKRCCSRCSCPKALTTRAAASASCTTDMAELWCSLTSYHRLRKRCREALRSPKSTGATPSAISASCQSIRAVT